MIIGEYVDSTGRHCIPYKDSLITFTRCLSGYLVCVRVNDLKREYKVPYGFVAEAKFCADEMLEQTVYDFMADSTRISGDARAASIALDLNLYTEVCKKENNIPMLYVVRHRDEVPEELVKGWWRTLQFSDDTLFHIRWVLAELRHDGIDTTFNEVFNAIQKVCEHMNPDAIQKSYDKIKAVLK